MHFCEERPFFPSKLFHVYVKSWLHRRYITGSAALLGGCYCLKIYDDQEAHQIKRGGSEGKKKQKTTLTERISSNNHKHPARNPRAQSPARCSLAFSRTRQITEGTL